MHERGAVTPDDLAILLVRIEELAELVRGRLAALEERVRELEARNGS
jgi:hypothetical protein